MKAKVRQLNPVQEVLLLRDLQAIAEMEAVEDECEFCGELICCCDDGDEDVE